MILVVMVDESPVLKSYLVLASLLGGGVSRVLLMVEAAFPCTCTVCM